MTVFTVNKLTFKSLLSPLFLLIFSAVFLSTLGDQVITVAVERAVSSKDGLSNSIWLWGALSLVNAIALPMLTALFGSYFLIQKKEGQTLTSFVREHIELLSIETMRSWGKAFLWAFVFVLPGIWKFFTYTLTPYVVMFSKKYQRGEVDALEYSTYICKKNWKAVNWWLTVFYLFVPVVSYAIFEPYRALAQTPISATIVILIKSGIDVMFHYQMLKILIYFINQTEQEPPPEELAAVEPAVVTN